MKIRSARFVTSLDALRSFPGRGLPQIAMVGRSNVGKSSFINGICGNSHLARTSSEPGKTRLINIYNINESFLLVDLPGYGFAKASKAEKQRWGAMIEGYLSQSDRLVYAYQLVDIRHDPTGDDAMMVEYLRHYGIPFGVLATKADKVSGAKRAPSVMAICRALQVQPWQVHPYSAMTNIGADAILADMERALTAPQGSEDESNE